MEESMSSVSIELYSRVWRSNFGPPVAVRSAEDGEIVQAGAPGMADGVDRLELDRHHARDPGCVAVADDAMALDDVRAVGKPAPRAGERIRLRQVVGVENTHEFALSLPRGRR